MPDPVRSLADRLELRERAKEDAAKWCRAHSIVPNGTLAAALTEVIYAFGEAARAEQRVEIIGAPKPCCVCAGDVGGEPLFVQLSPTTMQHRLWRARIAHEKCAAAIRSQR